ncbi:MAG: hypothetical protein V7637_5672 [Mycobacteriales bacterium]
MELTSARRVGAALAAAGLAFSVLAGVTGVGHLAARSAVAGASTDAGLITEVGFPKVVADGAAALPAVDLLAEPVETTSHDHGPENFQTK